MSNIDLDTWIVNATLAVRAHKLATLRRWSQQDCERCGGPLETLFDSEGRNPIRICMPCRHKEDDLAEEREDAMLAEQAAWDDIWPI